MAGLYESLSTPTSIRLLQILEEAEDTDLACLMLEFQLGTIEDNIPHAIKADIPAFEALSYTWGPSSPETCPRCAQHHECETTHGLIIREADHVVSVNDQPLVVGKNLHCAIAQLRRRASTGTKEKWIWIDAICINQRDTAERSAQVQLMGRIYSLAERTVVWLGPDDDTASIGVDGLKTMAMDLDFFRAAGIRDTFESPMHFRCVLNLFKRCWWRRRWILQEVVLAAEVVVLCGSMEILWRDLIDVARAIEVPSEQMLRDLRPFYAETRSTYTARCLGWLRQLYLQKPGTNRLMLYDLLCLGHAFECTVPQDAIFALIGLADGQRRPPHLLPAIDYDIPLWKVYITVTRRVIDESQSLAVLAWAGGDPVPSAEYHENLPSWVPAYHRGGPKTITRVIDHSAECYDHCDPNGKCFDAARGVRVSSFHFLAEPESTCLRIPMCHFDRVQRVYGTEHTENSMASKVTLLLSASSILPSPYATGDALSSVLLGTIMGGKTMEGAMLGSLPISQSQALVATWYQVLRESLETLAEKGDTVATSACERELERLSIRSQVTRAADLRRSPAFPRFILRMSQVTSCRSFFVTEKGLLGVGSSHLRIHDVICIAPAANTPLVVRPQANSRYKFMGDAYVHGLMFGEEAPFVIRSLQETELN